MTNKRSTKHALLMSALALLLCVSMLVGSTYAWFTDSVTSTGNIIKSGTLDVEMYWADGTKAVPADDSTVWKNAAEGAIFKSELWEPGYTEVRHIKIANVGTLALKYQLSIAANGEVTDLADVIDVYYVDSAVQVTDRTALTEDMKLGTLTEVLAGVSTTASGNLKAGENHTVTLALKMQESAGNKYQDKSIGSEFAVQLLATQLTSEVDSFDNQYDVESAWDGVYPTEMPDTLVVDTKNHIISINDTAAFAYFNTLVNDEDFYDNYGSKWKYSIELNTDVNLMGKAWTPIVLSNFVSFDGKGHTISNLNVSTSEKYAGLFADIACNDIGVTYVSNLVIDGAYVKGDYYVGALAGTSTQGSIKNVTINNATVIGNKYVGGVFGWGNGSVNDSTVKNTTVLIPEGGEKEAGGLAGYISNDGKYSTENKVIAGNTVENVTIVAPTIASGLVSQPNSSNEGSAVIEIKNNTMNNVTITTSDDTADLYVSNNVSGKTIVVDNTATDCKLGVGAETAEDIASAIEAGKNVVLTSDVKLENEALAVAAGQEVVIDLNGKTLSTVNTESKASAAINNKGTLTLKNGTVTYKGVGDPNFGYGTNTIHNTGKLVIDGATIINTTDSGSSVAIDCAAGAELIVNSGVIKSVKNAIRLCPFSSAAISCTINGGEITGARAVQIHLPSNKPAEAPEISLTINGGTLTTLGSEAVYSYSYGQSFANTKVTITGGTFNGGVVFGGGSAKTTQENVIITGGTFNGDLGRYLENDGWEDIAKPQ